jgi:DNA-binding response OmpR family regulator
MSEKKVLIVEDELPMRQALVSKFQDAGFKTLEAGDGEEGLKIALKEHPDMIILDILMPKMDGISMLKELKKDHWGNAAAVILLTNISDSARLAEALELGIEDYLIKAEWKLRDLVEKVNNRLGIV